MKKSQMMKSIFAIALPASVAKESIHLLVKLIKAT